MTSWSNAQLRVYDDFGRQLYYSEDVIDSQNNLVWHEIGRGASVTVPFFGTNADFIFDRDRRLYVTALNLDTYATHILADCIIESATIEETSQGDNHVTLIKVTGRDQIKALAEIPARRRHISKWRPGDTAQAIGKTTLQMNATDTAAFASMSLVGWTVELADGNWSEIIKHEANGLLTIDPAWQVNVNDDDLDGGEPQEGDENHDPPPVQRFSLYGAAFTETTGNYTDLKQVLSSGYSAGRGDWVLYEDGYQSSTNGSFVAPGSEASKLKVLQMIAAQTGEYFVRVPGTREIQWRREVPPLTHPQYGYPLNLVVDENYDPFREAVILPGAKLTYDAYDRATRVKPTGAGSGDEALTLKDLPPGFSVAAGYALNGEYLVYSAGETAGNYTAKDLRYDSIGPASDAAASRQLAAQALYNAALLWLREHNSERLIFECEVISAIPIEPVTYVYVTKIGHALDNKLMYVLDVTVTYQENQVVYKLQLSDKKAPILTEERLLAEAIRQTDVQLFYTNAPARNSRKLDSKAVAAGGGGGGVGHEPVTAGNAAIGVAPGQVVSLQLAGPSGLEVASTGLRLNDSVAGNGLGISNKVLSLNLAANSGLLLAADTLALGLPGNVGVDSSNQVVGTTHYHAVTSYANAKTNPAQLLKSDTFGDVTLRNLTADKLIAPELEAAGSITLDPGTSLIFADGNLSFIGARQIVTDTGSLTLAPAQTLIIDPADNVAQLGTDTTLRTAHAAVGVFPQTGWQVNYSGAGYFTSLFADELHVQSFIADIMRVKVGGEYIPESMALISRVFTIPVVGGTATLYVEDIPGWGNIAAFADGDWILLRIVDRSGGGLIVANAYGQVTNYADLGGGEQSWTFTTRIATTAVGRIARRGDLALDFGKSGSSWWYVTVLDRTGPHAGFGTWQGNNPTEGITYPIRLGQLHGVSGVNEMGFQAGGALSARTRFTTLRNEIHGSRFSLYAGDGAQLRVCAADLLFYTNSTTFQTLVPNADHSSLNVTTTGGTYYQTVDEGTTSPVLSDYIGNATNTAGYVMLGLGNPAAFAAIYQIRLKYALAGVNFSNDTVRLYAQVFQADELTPLTGEVLVQTRTTNAGASTGTVTLPHHDPAATTTEWNGARLRLRWEYDINANEEAIRLDPQVPSLAVGNPLPTGPATGGDGFWVGRDAGLYKLRLGEASGVGLDWTGTTLAIRNSANQAVIELDSSGNSRFAGAMTIGTSGGIWQGTGTFTTPTTGLKLYNSGGIGRLSTFNSGLEQLTINTNGQLTAGDGKVVLDRNGLGIIAQATSVRNSALTFIDSGGTLFADVAGITPNPTSRYLTLRAWKDSTFSTIRMEAFNGGGQIDLQTQGAGVFVGPSSVRVSTGLTIGDDTSAALDSVILIKERTAAPAATPSGFAQFWVQRVAGVQKLYVKFDNAAQREIATA